MSNNANNFWEDTPLSELSKEEWERLCDHCGRCCLHKLEDEYQTVHFTNVACRYLVEETCTCKHYQKRQTLVKNCLNIQPDWGDKFNWLPHTCAYRLRHENKPLPSWHPLISNDPNSVYLAGISIRGRTHSDKIIKPKDYHKHVIDWIHS